MMRRLPILCVAILLGGGLVILFSGCEGSYEDEDDLPTYRGKPVKQWILDLKGDKDYRKRMAKRNLDAMGPDDKDVVPALIVLVSDDDKFVRVTALKLLCQIGPNAKKALPAVDNATLDKERDVLQAAVQARMQIYGGRP